MTGKICLVLLLCRLVGSQEAVQAEALTEAAQHGSLEQVKAILENHPSVVDFQDRHTQTALMLAARFGRTETAKVILEHRPNVDLQSKDGETALMWAVQRGDTEIAKAILEHRPNVDLQSKDGETALMWAVQRGDTEIAKAILEQHPNVDLQSKKGRTALMLAAWYGYTEIAKAILEHHPNLDLQSEAGLTALIRAALRGHTEIAKAILEHHPNLDLRSKNGWTALMWAAVRGHVAIAQALLKADSSMLNWQDGAGRTGLFLAAENGHPEMVRFLVFKGARTELKARSGKTPLAAALAASGFDQDSSTVKLLKKITPTGLDLAEIAWTSRNLWINVGAGMAAGIVAGCFLHCLRKRSHIEAKGTGAKKVVLKALRRDRSRLTALRALDVVAGLVLPLGIAMLFIEVRLMVPIYFGIYIFPAAWQLGLARSIAEPCVLLAGLKRGPGCDARLPRVLATVGILFLVGDAQSRCHLWIDYGLEGLYVDPYDLSDPISWAMVLMKSPLLNKAGGVHICFSKNAMPPGVKTLFFLWVCFICGLAALWVIVTLCDMIGLCGKQEETDEEEVMGLAESVQATHRASEITSLAPGILKPEVGFACDPAPSGIYFIVVLAVMDGVLLDALQVFNLGRAMQFQFAGLVTAIVTASSAAEILGGRLVETSLKQEVDESVRRGFMSDALMGLLHLEQAVEGPLSLALSAYAWVFAIQDIFALLSGGFSLMLGIRSMADSRNVYGILFVCHCFPPIAVPFWRCREARILCFRAPVHL